MTVFSCGVFVVGVHVWVTWNHAVGDGSGLGQFMQAINVDELAGLLPSPSVVRPGRTVGSRLACLRSVRTTLSLSGASNRLRWRCSTSWLVNRTQGQSTSMNHGWQCSAFEAVAAVTDVDHHTTPHACDRCGLPNVRSPLH